MAARPMVRASAALTSSRYRPDVINNAKRHRGRTAQRFVDSAEVIEAHPKRDSGAMVLKLLAETVCEPLCNAASAFARKA
jgi:hypothetical protein